MKLKSAIKFRSLNAPNSIFYSNRGLKIIRNYKKENKNIPSSTIYREILKH